MKRKLNKPAVHVFRLSRCGSKMKLERQQSMKRLSPNFQDADVIVLAVALFKLAAVPWTKASLPHVFLCKPRFSFVEVGCSRLKLFSTVWDDTEHLLLMYRPQIQCKDLSCSHDRRVKDAERQYWTAMVPDPHLFFFFHTSVSFTGSFSVFQTCQESQSDDYSEGSTDTEEKVSFKGS